MMHFKSAPSNSRGDVAEVFMVFGAFIGTIVSIVMACGAAIVFSFLAVPELSLSIGIQTLVWFAASMIGIGFCISLMSALSDEDLRWSRIKANIARYAAFSAYVFGAVWSMFGLWLTGTVIALNMAEPFWIVGFAFSVGVFVTCWSHLNNIADAPRRRRHF